MKKIKFILIGMLITSSVFGQKAANVTSTDTGNQKVKDIDGNTYKTVKIGEQIWMAENLKTTKYRNGTPIPLVETDLAWNALNSGGYCWYYNDPETYKNMYGAIYNWYCIADKHNLCPADWHVPSDNEWIMLIEYLGGAQVAGGKMKENNTLHWISPNVGSTNESGFTALPGGDRHDNGPFYDPGFHAYWWSATEYDTRNAWMYNIIQASPGIERGYFTKQDGFYVRCVKDLK